MTLVTRYDFHRRELEVVSGDQGQRVERTPGGPNVHVVGLKILIGQKRRVTIRRGRRVGRGVEEMIVIVVVNLVIVLRAEIQPIERIPVRADDILLVEPAPVGVAEQTDGAAHHFGRTFSLVAIAL